MRTSSKGSLKFVIFQPVLIISLIHCICFDQLIMMTKMMCGSKLHKYLLKRTLTKTLNIGKYIFVNATECEVNKKRLIQVCNIFVHFLDVYLVNASSKLCEFIYFFVTNLVKATEFKQKAQAH